MTNQAILKANVTYLLDSLAGYTPEECSQVKKSIGPTVKE